MPLIKSSSDIARSTNIAEMIRSGYPRDQAIAASYRNQSEAKRHGMAAGGAVHGVHRMATVAITHRASANTPNASKGSEPISGPVTQHHRNALGKDNAADTNPNGVGKPSTECKVNAHIGKGCW